MEYFSLSEAAKILRMSIERILREAESGRIELEERCLYSDDVSEVIGYYKMTTNDVTRVLAKPGEAYEQVLWNKQAECPGAKLSRTADINNIVIFEGVLNEYQFDADGTLWLNSEAGSTSEKDKPDEGFEELSPTIKPRVKRIIEISNELDSTKRQHIEREFLKDQTMTEAKFDKAWRKYKQLNSNK
jgi:hypothetical protein